MLDVFDFSNS